MEDALAKIRSHTSSKLAHQKTPAVLLHALEATFSEQNAEKTPTAYFAAVLTTLDATLQKGAPNFGEGDVLPAELYLLALVSSFVPPPIIRLQLNTLLTLTAPLFPLLLDHAPPLRSQLTIYRSIFLSVERSQLDVQGLPQSFASILHLSADHRPKVRKKAADLIRDVLSSPPPPMLRHPYSDRVAQWVKSSLAEVNTGVLSRLGKGSNITPTDVAMHVLALLRPIVPYLPPPALPPITDLLLSTPRLGDAYLSQSAYSIILHILNEIGENHRDGEISRVLKAVLTSAPSVGDKVISPTWLQLVGNAMVALNASDPHGCADELAQVWKTVWAFLESTNGLTRVAAAQALEQLTQCITPELIAVAVKEAGSPSPSSTLCSIIAQSTTALGSLAYAPSMAEVLAAISYLIICLQYRKAPSAPTAAELLLSPTIQRIAALRIEKRFEFKEAADLALSAAFRVMGPEVVLRILPLNLEPEDRHAGSEPRAFLLPLIAQPHPSPLRHFTSYFVPLSERMFNLQQKATNEGRASEAKVWSVLVSQIWTGFSGYCWGTVDLRESVTPEFSQILSQLLYSQPELRPAVLKGLKTMVDSNLDLLSPDQVESDTAPGANKITADVAAQNVAFLRTQAESWLAVLFNVFGSMGRDGRGMVGDVISAWAAIAEEAELTTANRKVVNLFKENLAKPQTIPPINLNDGGSIAATSADLLILLLPYLPSADASALFKLCLSVEVLGSKDSGVQKRGYKILTRLVDSEKVRIDAEAVLRQLNELADCLAAAAKKDRFNLLTLLIPCIPATAMHTIPSLIPEAVLGTKEPSDKARSAAFELIVAMGRKMNEGGVVKRDKVVGMDEDGIEVVASVEEYITMIAAGLAGASPHMISATVTAISRLIFEFKDDISPQMHTEILSTLLVFLTSSNREIVKSTLGYIKLAIHTLSTSLLKPHLKELVPALLRWSHDHKNHFKSKVRHIFERMLRRFGWEDVWACAGEEEAAKVLLNIKKRKERAKRKRARADDEDDEDDAPAAAKPDVGDAFEDVLYGSESDGDDSDTESVNAGARKMGGAQGGPRLRVDDDEPMDLLQGAAARITNAQSNRRRKPGQDASHFKTDEDTGKMIIDDVDSNDEVTANPDADVAGTAYRESLTAVDGFTRGQGGRVKFNKDTKKRRRENEDGDGDVEMGDDAGAGAARGKGRKAKRPSEARLGHEFKAKKAGGDVKKGGVDPYAYISLAQAAKKSGRGGKERIGIASKR